MLKTCDRAAATPCWNFKAAPATSSRQARPASSVLVLVPEPPAPTAYFLAAIQALSRGFEPVDVLVAAQTAPEFLMIEPFNRSMRAVLGVSTDGLEQALGQSSHPLVAWGAPLPRETGDPQKPKRMFQVRSHFDTVWSWCPSLPCGKLLGRERATVAVQARVAPGTSALPAVRDLLVRSTLTSHEWVRHPRPQPPDASATPVEWERPAACVGYGYASGAHAGQMMLVQAAEAEGRSTPTLLWPLRWPSHAIQGTSAPQHVVTKQDYPLEAAVSSLIAAAASRASGGGANSTEGGSEAFAVRFEARRGFVTQLMQDNMFHALFHAVSATHASSPLTPGPPATSHRRQASQPRPRQRRRARVTGYALTGRLPWQVPLVERARRLGIDSSDTDILPRYTRFWPTPLQLAEAGANTQSWAHLLRMAQWYGWQLTMRGMFGPAAREVALARTQTLISRELGTLHCYTTVYGGHATLWPSWANLAAVDAVAPRLRQFRAAVLANSLVPSPPPRPSARARQVVLALRRNGSRRIVNSDELAACVEQNDLLRGRVAFAHLEDLTMTQQLELVS